MFCQYHVQKLIDDEIEAQRYWRAAMRRAEQAVFAGRTQSAELYLQCALDVVRLRSDCLFNQHFSVTHLLQPLESLIEINKKTDNYGSALELLETIEQNFANSKLVGDVTGSLAVLASSYRQSLAS